MKLITKITAITMTLILEYLSRSSLFIKFIFKNYKAGYLPLYFKLRQLLQSLWKIPVSSVLASQKTFSASFSSFRQTSQMSKMYPDFDSYIIRIKKFSSPKIKIWFPPSLKLRTGRRADVFLRVLWRFYQLTHAFILAYFLISIGKNTPQLLSSLKAKLFVRY